MSYQSPQEKIEEKEYATIFQLCLHETTLVRTTRPEEFNDYMVYTSDHQVTRVHGGWLYRRIHGNMSIENFVPDTRHEAAQERANRPRQ